MSKSSLYATLPSARSIRLLQLHPGADEERVSCSLEVVEDFLSPPRYQALSYCWGDKNDLTELSCNGETSAVTKNLYAALHRLRQREHAKLVWVDALCINQDDIPERNQQVSIMNKVYWHASRVFVWVGPGDEDTMETMEMIRLIAHRIHENCDPGAPIASWLSKLPAENDKGKVISEAYPIKAKDFPRARWQSFWNFYQAGWFFRVWVIQEVRQKLDVWLLCGAFEIEWDLVALSASWAWIGANKDFITHWRKHYFPSYSGFINATLMWDQTLSTRRQAPFLAILHLARLFQSTDPRDKVFAMLHHRIDQHVMDDRGNLIEKRHYPLWPQNTPRTHLDLQPDYNMSTYEVYRKLAMQSLQQYQNLETLCYAWQTAHYSSSWPSWIPRWDIPNNHMTPILLPFLYNAARGSDLIYHFNSNPDSLSVQGLNLRSPIETTSVLKYQTMNSQEPGLDNSTNEWNLLAILRLISRDRWNPDMSSESTATRSQRNMQTHFANFSSYVLRLIQDSKENSYISLYSIWCSHCKNYISLLDGGASPTPSRLYHCGVCDHGDFDLCTACYRKGERCKVPSHTLRELGIPSLWIPYTEEVVETLKAHAVGGQYERFLQNIWHGCKRMVFFKTSQGWQGTASAVMEPGDIIVVLFGSRVPFVLRKCGSAYRLVSDCYVQGLMDGEAIDMWNNGELQLEEFEIR